MSSGFYSKVQLEQTARDSAQWISCQDGNSPPLWGARSCADHPWGEKNFQGILVGFPFFFDDWKLPVRSWLSFLSILPCLPFLVSGNCSNLQTFQSPSKTMIHISALSGGSNSALLYPCISWQTLGSPLGSRHSCTAQRACVHPWQHELLIFVIRALQLCTGSQLPLLPQGKLHKLPLRLPPSCVSSPGMPVAWLILFWPPNQEVCFLFLSKMYKAPKLMSCMRYSGGEC